MKQMIFFVGLVTSLCLVGCMKTVTNNESIQPTQESVVTHQDLKGEVAK